MKNMKTYTGLLSLHNSGEAEDILFLSALMNPLALELEWMSGKIITVRYWITDQEKTKEEAKESFINSLAGIGDIEYTDRYSEITGYLWTDENLNIGGHNLLDELKSYVGKWLILEVEYQNV